MNDSTPDRLLGHTVDGFPVIYFSEDPARTGRTQHYLEAGVFRIQLDHIEPRMLDLIALSLVAPRLAVAS